MGRKKFLPFAPLVGSMGLIECWVVFMVSCGSFGG